MANTPNYEDAYKRVSEFITSGNKGQINLDQLIPKGTAGDFKPFQAPKQEQGWNLGQGLIDALSVGTYAVAGVGQKVGENVQAIQQGDLGGALDLANPLSIIPSAGGGIQNRRTWHDNLTDWGVSEEDSFWPGLALDIALDPLWLVPGGAVISGIKGTSKGIGLASAATKGGVQLSKPALEAAKGDIVFSKQGVTLPTDKFGTGGSFINNLIEGVKFGNVEEYGAWSKARQAKKDLKAAQKAGTVETQTGGEFFNNEGPLAAMAAGIKRTTDETAPAAERIVQEIEDVADINATPKSAELDAVKSADPVTERVLETAPVGTFKEAREFLQPARQNYITSRGLEAPEIDYKAIQVSPLANDIAQAYNKLVSNPNDPVVKEAYAKLVSEVEDQYKYLTEDLGIKIEYIEDGDAYMKLNASGELVPDPSAMMRDIIDNKTLKVRGSAQDYAQNAHPILSLDANNKFRAVHDFFGHAASGRGFMADGEEAAWVAHSTMFTPLARRAMTTETRGQNSYYNFFDPEKKQFAPQKAALLPDEFVATPIEAAAVESRIGSTNTFIGVASNALVEFADDLIAELGMVSSPLRGVKRYSPEELKAIRAELDRTAGAEFYAPETTVSKGAFGLVKVLKDLVAAPSAGKYASLYAGENSITGLLELAQKAFNVEGVANQKDRERSLAAFRQLLDQPVDATDLLESALKVEDRVVSQPAPFKPTNWGPSPKAAEITKPPFTQAKLEKYFPGDEILLNPENLEIAMGTVKVRPGTKRAKDLLAKQAVLWDHFRARNADVMPDVAAKERLDWFNENSIDNSELYTQMADGTMIGQGLLPESIPYGVLTIQNGRPTTTLAMVLENMGKVINRTGPQMGGLPTSQIVGGRSRIASPTESIGSLPAEVTEGVDEFFVVPRAEPFTEIEGKGKRAVAVAGARLETPAAKQIRAKLKARGRDIELDSYPLALQDWLLTKIDDVAKTVKTKGVKDMRLIDKATDLESAAVRLWEAMPQIKSLSDARLLVSLGPDAVTQLSKTPARKYFIDAPVDRITGRPMGSTVGRQEALKGTRNPQGQILRDPQTGVAIDANGKPIPEAQGIEGGYVDADGNVKKGDKYAQYRVMTDDGKKFTGREKGSYASQVGTGNQQLANLQLARATIGSITEGITAGAMKSSPEQAQLLSNVMSSLGIRVAENATPSKIFKQFEQEASIKFEETIRMIESAAKSESVVYQLRLAFPAAISDNISIMKAIERIDASELQKRTVNWTEDAMAMVDQSCQMMTRGNVNYGDSVLRRVLGGLA